MSNTAEEKIDRILEKLDAIQSKLAWFEGAFSIWKEWISGIISEIYTEVMLLKEQSRKKRED